MQLDGFVLSYLPAGVGELVEDFAYEWDDVSFTSRVWEREIEDGHQVDLQVLVLRGPRLASATELRDFLADYHERDPDDWALDEFQHGDAAGFISDAEAFWLVESGVAVVVRIAAGRFGVDDLRATALGVHPADPDETRAS